MMNSRIAMVALVGTSLLAACGDAARISGATRGSGAAAFDKGGNSDAAQACQQGGWQHLQGSDGTLFQNTGECVSYAAHGGTLVPIPVLPIIASFTFNGIGSECDTGGGLVSLFTAVFSNGTATITDPSGFTAPVTSGVQAAFGLFTGNFVLTVSNSSGSVSQTLSEFFDPGLGCSVNANRRPRGRGGLSTGGMN